MNVGHWHCDVIFVNCSCTRKLPQRPSSLVNNGHEYRCLTTMAQPLVVPWIYAGSWWHSSCNQRPSSNCIEQAVDKLQPYPCHWLHSHSSNKINDTVCLAIVTRSTSRVRFLSLARSKLRLCSANHRPGYWSNLPCDWPSLSLLQVSNRKWSQASSVRELDGM